MPKGQTTLLKALERGLDPLTYSRLSHLTALSASRRGEPTTVAQTIEAAVGLLWAVVVLEQTVEAQGQETK